MVNSSIDGFNQSLREEINLLKIRENIRRGLTRVRTNGVQSSILEEVRRFK